MREKLIKMGSIFSKNSGKINEALITREEDYNAQMVEKRFHFLANSYAIIYNVLKVENGHKYLTVKSGS